MRDINRFLEDVKWFWLIREMEVASPAPTEGAGHRPHYAETDEAENKELVEPVYSTVLHQSQHPETLPFLDRTSEVRPLFREADLERLEKTPVIPIGWGNGGEDTENSSLLCTYPGAYRWPSCGPCSDTTLQTTVGVGEESESPRTLTSSEKRFVS